MENIVNSTIALYKAYRKTRCGKRDNPTAMRYRMEAHGGHRAHRRPL